ncbi:MAG: YeeE/YedE thiosulfate transporter family protein [Pseudomonadota bacterium]
MIEYWPWWLGALALAGITLGFWTIVGRPLGVSGSWGRITGWRESRKVEKIEASMRKNPSAMEDALLAATLAEFGEQQTLQTLYAAGAGAAPLSNTRRPAPAAARKVATAAPLADRTSWGVHVTFLMSMLVGGLFAAISTGELQWHFDLGTVHTAFFGNGMEMWFALLLGGAMVGFGTQMGGGCTSGHGLSGCSRLVPASLVATCMFFGSAVAVSFFVEVISK